MHVVAESMKIHRRHVEMIGEPVHNASIAASRVRSIIGLQAYNSARSAHRSAGRMRHKFPVDDESGWFCRFSLLDGMAKRSVTFSAEVIVVFSAGLDEAEDFDGDSLLKCTLAKRIAADSTIKVAKRMAEDACLPQVGEIVFTSCLQKAGLMECVRVGHGTMAACSASLLATRATRLPCGRLEA
jgi:hypothetical protein